MYFFYAQNVSVLEKKVNELVALLHCSAQVYGPPCGMHRQHRGFRRGAFDRTVSVNAEAGNTKQETAIILKDCCAFSRLRVRPVFVSRVGPNGHLRPKIGGTWSPFFGRIEFPTLYPTIVPRIPVPADWSILPIAIRTVIQIIATKTMSALGGFVMFIRR